MIPLWADYAGALAGMMNDHGFKDELEHCIILAKEARDHHCRAFFIGNGGSAAIASHMASDWQKAGGIPSMCFNDAASVTALGNDRGFESIFSEPIRMHGTAEDLLFAISSSGESEDILVGVDMAVSAGMHVITLSGFNAKNSLNGRGVINFHVPNTRYGLVEVTHFAILHHILDRVVADA